MKNFPLKAEWVAEHRNGDKCYYYPGTGWISAHDGLVTGFDLVDVPVVPEDATHVQFIDGKIQYVRHFEASVCVDIWHKGAWGASCTLQKLPGTVVRIKDGDVLGSPYAAKTRIQPEAAWVDVAYNQRPQGLQNATLLEVDYGLGGTTHCAVCDAIWADVKRWRYAS